MYVMLPDALDPRQKLAGSGPESFAAVPPPKVTKAGDAVTLQALASPLFFTDMTTVICEPIVGADGEAVIEFTCNCGACCMVKRLDCTTEEPTSEPELASVAEAFEDKISVPAPRAA
jgi:hypothetical protein